MGKPICCEKRMRVNQHRVNRVSGSRRVYICRVCGKTKTVKIKEGK